jgi:hypothetical protein
MKGGENMGKLIGLFLVALFVIKSCNRKIDGSRVKKWWDEEDK